MLALTALKTLSNSIALDSRSSTSPKPFSSRSVPARRPLKMPLRIRLSSANAIASASTSNVDVPAPLVRPNPIGSTTNFLSRWPIEIFRASVNSAPSALAALFRPLIKALASAFVVALNLGSLLTIEAMSNLPTDAEIVADASFVFLNSPPTAPPITLPINLPTTAPAGPPNAMPIAAPAAPPIAPPIAAPVLPPPVMPATATPISALSPIPFKLVPKEARTLLRPLSRLLNAEPKPDIISGKSFEIRSASLLMPSPRLPPIMSPI